MDQPKTTRMNTALMDRQPGLAKEQLPVCIASGMDNGNHHEPCDVTLDPILWSTPAFVTGVTIGVICMVITPYCFRRIRIVLPIMKSQCQHLATKVFEMASRRFRLEGDAELMESTEVFNNIPIPRDLQGRSIDEPDSHAWPFMNGGAALNRTPSSLMNAQDELIRAMTRRIKALEERERTNSDLLYAVKREQRYLKNNSGSGYAERRSHLMEGTAYSETPLLYGITLRISSLEQKISEMQNSNTNNPNHRSDQSQRRKSLISYTSVAPKDEPTKYIDLNPFYTTSRPSTFTLPYAPLSHYRYDECKE